MINPPCNTTQTGNKQCPSESPTLTLPLIGSVPEQRPTLTLPLTGNFPEQSLTLTLPMIGNFHEHRAALTLPLIGSVPEQRAAGLTVHFTTDQQVNQTRQQVNTSLEQQQLHHVHY